MVRREDCCLVIRICQQQSQDVSYGRGYSRKRMDLFEMSQKQLWIYFCWKFILSYDIVTLTAICKATWFQQFFKKCDNLLPIYKDSSNHLQDWINLIWSDLCITVTWHLAGLLRPTCRNHWHCDQGVLNDVSLTSKVLSSVTTTIICPKEKDF